MNAYDVAKPITSSVVDGFTFAFGIDQAKVAAQFRKLADAIEGGNEVIVLAHTDGSPQIILERLSVETVADREDFTTTKITMTIVEKVKAP